MNNRIQIILLLAFLLIVLLLLGYCSEQSPTTGGFSQPAVNLNPTLHTPQYIGYSDFRPIPLAIAPKDPTDPASVARAFFQSYKKLFGLIDSDEEMRVASQVKDLSAAEGDRGPLHVKMQQYYNNLPVFWGEAIVHLSRNLDVVGVTAHSTRKPQIGNITPSLNSTEAVSISRGIIGDAAVSARQSLPVPTSETKLGVWIPALRGGKGKAVLAYRIQQYGYVTYLDATTGVVLLHYDDIRTARNRETYDDGNIPNNTNPTLVLSESTACPTSADQEICNLHQFIGDTYDYFFSHFQRDAIDSQGTMIRSHGNYMRINWCPNAESTMVFCDNAVANDIVAHEYGHAVTSQLVTGGLSGPQGPALDESFADIFGALVDTGDWTIGEDTVAWGGGINGALRDMANPPRFSHPDHYSNYVPNGNEHVNNGILNKAAWLLGEGGTHHGFTIQAIGREKLGQIVYATIQNGLTSASDMPSAARAMFIQCKWLSFNDPNKVSASDCDQVAQALAAVGMLADIGIDSPSEGASVGYGGLGLGPDFLKVHVDSHQSGGNWTVEWSTDLGRKLDSQQPSFFKDDVGARSISAKIALKSIIPFNPIVSSTVHINILNYPPVADIPSPTENAEVVNGFGVMLQGIVSDPNEIMGIPCSSFQWATGNSSDSPSVITGDCQPVVSFGNPGPRAITLKVTDELGAASSITRNMLVTTPKPNSPPLVRIDFPKPNQWLAPDNEVTLAGAASDPDGDMSLKFTWTVIFERGATNERREIIGNGALLNWIPGQNVYHVCGGAHPDLELSVTDSSGQTGTALVPIDVPYPPC